MLGLLVGAAVASSVISSVGEAATTARKKKKQTMQDMIFVTQEAFEFEQKNYLDVVRSLLGMGFTNVHAIEIRKYRQGMFTNNKYGKVESVSINGDDCFSKGDGFAKGAHVVVSFHVFKDSPPVVIPELQNLNPPPNANPQSMYPNQQPIHINVNIDNGMQRNQAQNQQQSGYYFDPNEERYCSYCRSLIPNRAAFCPRCGASVQR